MQVQLKQSEIIAALKQYISGQGISLNGKSVEMAFTAGRKESGISVEISIDDVSMPDFFKAETAETTAPVLTLVTDAGQEATEIVDETPAAEAVVEAQGTVVEAAADLVPVPTAKSLFN